MDDTVVHDDIGSKQAGAIDKDTAIDRRDGQRLAVDGVDSAVGSESG